MSRHPKHELSLLHWTTVISFFVLSTQTLPAQTAPVSPDHPWYTSAERSVEADAPQIPDSRFAINPAKTYSLPELVDMAETHNPATHDAWERARAQAASLGITRAELFPTLAAIAVSQTSRQQAFFGNRFYGQEAQDFQVELDLNYTLFDFGARTGRINDAKAQLLTENFAFNDIHRQVIYQVQEAYFRLLSSMGQEDAARASLSNAQAVQQASEERLAHGLATLPDVLEARSATAQAEYDLQAILGTEEIARGDLAAAVGTSATALIHIQPLNQVPTPDSIGDTVDEAIDRALRQRPDLMQQVAEIRSATARVKEAKAAYFPALTITASSATPLLYGLQSPYPWSHTADLVGTLSFNLQWTVFDGGARRNRLVQAKADVRTAEAQVNVTRDQIADEVWAAYSSLNTAFRQRQAALALLQASTESYSATLESYKYGVRNLLDVTAAQRTLAQARTADVLAQTQVLTAFAELTYRTGDSIRANGGSQP
jgi:outer membrane protein